MSYPDKPRPCHCEIGFGGYCYRSLCPAKLIKAARVRIEAREKAQAEAEALPDGDVDRGADPERRDR